MSVCFGPCMRCGHPSTGLLFEYGKPKGPLCNECADLEGVATEDQADDAEINVGGKRDGGSAA